MMSHLNPLLRKRFNPSTDEQRRGALEFLALVAKHEDLLTRLLKRGVSDWRAVYWEREFPPCRQRARVSEGSEFGSRVEV